MMRLPIPAVLAVLAVVAAGSVVVTMLFKSAEYVVDVSGLAVGQNKTAELGFVPHRISVLSNVSATYAVYIYADAAFVDDSGAVYYGRFAASGVSSNSTITVKVQDARGTSAKIVVVRTS
jgi:hypothetical protein